MLPQILDLDDPSCKMSLETEIAEWVRIDESAQLLYHDEWNSVSVRLAGADTPTGLTTGYSADYATRRTADATKTRTQIYVPVNKAHSVREGILGDFITGKKSLATSGRNPTDRTVAKVYNKYIQFVLDENAFNDAVFMPAMDRCIQYGLDWFGAEYDPMGRNMRGTFKVYRVNCRDVLVDASANAVNGSFFQNDTRRTRRWKMNRDEANFKFSRDSRTQKYWKDVSADFDYDKPYIPTDVTMQRTDHSTFYWVDFKHFEDAIVIADQNTGKMDVVPILEAMKIDPKFHVGPTEAEFIYRAHYNRTGGNVYALERLPYTMFPLVPLQNVESDSRRYPLGDIAIYSSLFDLVNVMATVLVEGVKNAIKGRGVGRAPIRDQKLLDQITEAIKNGGYAPGLENIIYPGAPVQLISNVLNTVQGWIQEVASMHPVSEGVVPSQQIAAETVQLLQKKDRQSRGRKDVTVRYALTQLAKLLSEMISLHIEDEDMVQVMDAAPGGAQYIPINKTVTEDEYNAMLADIYELAPPQQPMVADPQTIMQYQMEVQQFLAALQKARKDFEKENDVKRRTEDGWKVPGEGGEDESVTDEALARTLGDAQMAPEDFYESVQPEPTKVQMYAINMLSERQPDLNVRFEVDQDWESDQEYRSNKAIMLISKDSDPDRCEVLVTKPF